MNSFEAYTVRHAFHGHAPMLRLPSDAEAKPIMQEGGRPVFFKTRERALDELLLHLLAYVNGDLRRDGITLSAGTGDKRMLTYKEIAEKALFKKEKAA